MVQVRTSVRQLVDPAAWHDIVVRYDGQRLEMFVDGVGVDQRPAVGDLRQNDEACIVGGYSVGGKVSNPFHGQIDHAALWQRAITDEEVAKLSGGHEFVAKHKQQMKKRQIHHPVPEVASYRSVLHSKDVAEFSKAALALRKWMIANDPFQPLYHFTGPESWINDPNGPIYYQGRYHLFYQFNPIVDGRKSATCWGHAVSSDLMHWADWPIAIWPDTPQDRAGVFSGNTFVDDNGDLVVTPESGDLLKTIKGDSLEIIATFKPATARRLGIKVRNSAVDPKLGVPVWFDAGDLTFGAGKASMSSDLKAGDSVTLHVFVDRSIIEVYVNGNANTVASHHDPAAQGIALFSAGGACTLETLDVWRMKSIWE
jgi:hypothetical protein